MSQEHSLINRSITGFNGFITKTTPFLIVLTGGIPNWTRYNWTNPNLVFWQGILSQWQPLYAQYLDKKQRTTALKDQLHALITLLVDYDKPNKLILKIKATVGATITDCETFNVPLSYAVNAGGPTAGTPAQTSRSLPTAELVYPKLKPMGGGAVKNACYPLNGKGRAHKLKGFDLVEFVWGVFAAGTTNLPTDANDPRLALGHSTHADFLLPTGTNNANKVLIIFFRWAKSKHPNLNGPWNGPFTTPIF
ncbi:MAG TPA: hypothetical protein VF411_07570 [Bacteroidia bacterium]